MKNHSLKKLTEILKVKWTQVKMHVYRATYQIANPKKSSSFPINVHSKYLVSKLNAYFYKHVSTKHMDSYRKNTKKNKAPFHCVLVQCAMPCFSGILVLSEKYKLKYRFIMKI